MLLLLILTVVVQLKALVAVSKMRLMAVWAAISSEFFRGF